MAKQQQFYVYCGLSIVIGIVWWILGNVFASHGWHDGTIFAQFGLLWIVLGLLTLGYFLLAKRERTSSNVPESHEERER